jgi:hypothetical protein
MPFKILELLVEKPLKKCVLNLFKNKCIIMSFFKKNYYHMKEEEIL